MGDWLYRIYVLALCGTTLGIVLWIDSASSPLYPRDMGGATRFEDHGDASPDCIVTAGEIEFCGDDAAAVCETLEPSLIELRELKQFELADWMGAKACARLMR